MLIWAIALSALSIYLLLALITVLGQKDAYKGESLPSPSVSILVAARDEERNLERLLESLNAIDYPEDKIQILLVNDRSADRTGDLLEEFSRKRAQTRVLHIGELPSGWTGKANALASAAALATGEFLFFTDADCTVPKTWIHSHLSVYDRSTGISGGFVLLEAPGSPALHRVQSLDWLHLAAVGWGWSGLGIPISAFGNNLSMRKSAYESSGGFRPHPIEDFDLMRRVLKDRFRFRFVSSPDAAVHSRAVTLPALIRQKIRWAVGGRSHSGPGILLLAAGFFVRLLILLFAASKPAASMAVAGGTIAADFFVLAKPLFRFKRLDLVPWHLLYELYTVLYSILFFPIFLLGRSYPWKSESYSVECNGTGKNECEHKRN